MKGRRQTGNSTVKLDLHRLMLLLLAVVLLLALVLGGILLVKQIGHEEEPEQETVTVGGHEVVIDQELPQNQLEEDQFQRDETGTVTYSGESLNGIDVSAHQGEIDWSLAAADGVEFAMLRIGYRGYSQGGLNQDSRFMENYVGAKSNQVKVGVYFFSQALNEEEAREEAEQVLKWLEETPVNGPVAYDWEHVDDPEARTNETDGETITACAKAFCQVIAEAGLEPMVYCNGMMGYLSYDLKELEGIPIWYAEYQDHPSYAYEVEMWQYTDQGTISGIQGKVDRNIWFQREN